MRESIRHLRRLLTSPLFFFLSADSQACGKEGKVPVWRDERRASSDTTEEAEEEGR